MYRTRSTNLTESAFISYTNSIGGSSSNQNESLRNFRTNFRTKMKLKLFEC